MPSSFLPAWPRGLQPGPAALLGVAALLSLAAFALSQAGPLEGVDPADLLFHVPAVAGMGLLAGRVRQTHGRERLGLLALGATIVAWDAGDWVFSYYQAFHGREPDFPSLAEACYYTGYLFAIAAVPLLTMSRRQIEDRRWMFDAAIAAILTGTLGWLFLVLPRTEALHLSGWEAGLAFGYPVLDVILLISVAASWYSTGGRMSRRAQMLCAAFVLFVVTDSVYTATLVTNASPATGVWLDLGWMAVNWMIAAAVVLGPATGAAEERRPRTGVGALDLLPYAAGVPLVAAALLSPDDGTRAAVSLSAAVVAISLAAARQVLTLRENRLLVAELAAEADRQRRLAQALRDSEHFASTVVESVGEGVGVCGRDLRAIAWNRQMELVTGLQADSVLGLDLAGAFPPPAGEAVAGLVARALAGETANSGDVDFANQADGRPGTAVMRATPLTSSDGSIIGAVLVVHEVSAQRSVERALVQSQKMESLGVLAGGVAHDFNNLLTTIMGSCSLLRLPAEDGEPDGDTVGLIEEAAQRGAEIAGRLLAFARGGLSSFAPLDLRDVVTDTMRLVKPSLQEGVRVTVDLPCAGVMVEGDHGQLEQVLMNIVLNARDALPGGGSINVSLRMQDEEALLEVRDDGPGIDEQVRLRIFEPFFTTKPAGSGTGLGMAIAYGIVQQHGGTIDVDSAPGGGARFTARFPLAMEAGEGREAEPAMPGRRVLVVDDDALVRRIVAANLASFGLSVEEAQGGEDAIAALAADPDAYSCMFLDLVMPGMTGREVYHAVRALRPDLPVVVCTGFAPAGHVDERMARGIATYLPKPFTRARLEEAVHAAGLAPARTVA